MTLGVVMARAAWALLHAEHMGEKAARLLLEHGVQQRNPFTAKGCDDLAAAWQHAYDRAVHPSAGG